MKSFFTVLLCATFFFAQAQNDNFVRPATWDIDVKYTKAPIDFTGVPYDQLAAEDEANDQDKSIPWRFGYEFAADIDPDTHGQYIDLDNGDRIWLVNIKSSNAYTINLLFDWFKLSEGATMRVYSNDRTDVSKLFTHEHNNDDQMLGIWPVASDNVWVELYEPKDVVGKSRLEIGSVVHGYRSLGSSDLGKALNDSGPCNHDVNCDITPPGSDPFNLNQVKEDIKKSVGMVVVGSGTGICSGALVNNTNNDGAPYFLTANHCLGGTTTQWAFRFNWRSTVNRCASFNGSISGTFNQTANGAQLLMNSSQSDTALLRITDTNFFNNSPDVIWAGWNRSTTVVPALTFGIHHPSGDIQKVCRDDNAPGRVTTSFNGDGDARMWLINNNTGGWELGVTEPGSSGSPLFNQVGQIVGVLSAGSAACSGTVDNGGFDIYGRFGVGWDFGSAANSRLRDWLDPTNTGVTTVGTLSGDDIASSINISLYPNPVKENFKVEISEEATYSIYTISGQVLKSGELNAGLNTISMNDAAQGVYFIKVDTDNATESIKLIKE